MEHQDSGSKAALRRAASLLATIALLLVGVFAAAPASAHGGPIGAQAGPTGGGGVYVYIFYERDLHAVDELTRATVEGTLDGEKVGPIDLVASTTSPGRWETPGDAFTDGRWSLTVRYTEEHAGDGMIENPIQVNVTGSSLASMPTSVDASAASIWPFALAGGIAVAIVVAFVAVSVRRRSRSEATR